MRDTAEILDLCRARGLTVATAESCTGGMVGAALTDIAGSSDVYERGVITYSNAAKKALLGVKAETLAAHGAVSEEVAREMAAGLLAAAAVDIAVSVTGIAGPGGSEHKPEGRVCFGLATADGVETETVEFGALGRAEVRAAATAHALGLIGAAAARAAA
ncbi:MAG: CinA family protein [Maritimibacter sp.]|nr:CinA family protein [Maritimibacter sp.]